MEVKLLHNPIPTRCQSCCARGLHVNACVFGLSMENCIKASSKNRSILIIFIDRSTRQTNSKIVHSPHGSTLSTPANVCAVNVDKLVSNQGASRKKCIEPDTQPHCGSPRPILRPNGSTQQYVTTCFAFRLRSRKKYEMQCRLV